MTNVLLLCPEPLGHKHPAGVGIRFLEFARALRSAGHAVTVLSADGGAVEGCRHAPLTPETIREETARADAAVAQGHVVNDLEIHGHPLPVVVDLYDPFIIENFHYFDSMGPQVFQHDHGTLLRSVRIGDFFLCASEAQRLFYAGILLAAGRIHPQIFAHDPKLSSLLAIVPFGVPPPRPRSSPAPPNDLFFGGIYDWYDPIVAVEAVLEARKRNPALTLTFNYHPNAEITPQSAFSETRKWVERTRAGFVKFEPWTAYEERGRMYERFRLGLLTFRRSLETDLAMRTRMFDFLWGGLPVITSSAPGTDGIIERYGVGAVVKQNEPRVIADTILELLQPARWAEAHQNTTQFVRDHQWPDLLRPLLEFVANPERGLPSESPVAAKLDLPARPETLMHRLKRRLTGTR